jgi:lyso-ornithine lipid O-acyltransferase
MYIRLFILGITLIIVVIPMIIIQLLCLKMPIYISSYIPMRFHKMMLKFLRVNIVIKGDISIYTPTLFICNHWSWLDIPVLGAVLHAHFVAKSEIANWGIFGFLAKLQRTIFVSRQNRQRTAEQSNIITEYLADKRNIILFAEGTSSDGNRILPFKSSLLESAKPTDSVKPAVQSVTVIYHKLYGMPTGRTKRPFIAWYGDMEMGSHLKDFFNLGPVEVILDFGTPVYYDDFTSRKELSYHLESEIRHKFDAYRTA